MITIQLTDDERNSLLACIESAVKHAPNSLQAAASLLPLAQKLAQAKPDEPSTEA
jgi:hypothetical protein